MAPSLARFAALELFPGQAAQPVAAPAPAYSARSCSTYAAHTGRQNVSRACRPSRRTSISPASCSSRRWCEIVAAEMSDRTSRPPHASTGCSAICFSIAYRRGSAIARAIAPNCSAVSAAKGVSREQPFFLHEKEGCGGRSRRTPVTAVSYRPRLPRVGRLPELPPRGAALPRPANPAPELDRPAPLEPVPP